MKRGLAVFFLAFFLLTVVPAGWGYNRDQFTIVAKDTVIYIVYKKLPRQEMIITAKESKPVTFTEKYGGKMPGGPTLVIWKMNF